MSDDTSESRARDPTAAAVEKTKTVNQAKHQEAGTRIIDRIDAQHGAPTWRTARRHGLASSP